MNIDTIYCSDASIGLSANVDDNSVDLIVTSPPYDSIRDYNGFKLDLHAIGEQCFRVLKGGGVMAMVIQDGTKDFAKSLTTARTQVDYVDNIGFKLFENVIYHRNGRPGAWWGKRFRVDHEYILLFFKGDRPKYFNKKPLMVVAKYGGQEYHGTQRLTNGNLIQVVKKPMPDKKCRGTVWYYNPSSTESDKSKLKHPATFPDKLAEDLIICFSQEGDVVLDPMCGSGTACRMAKKNGRHYIGIDISQEYCKLSESMLDRETEAR